MMNRAADMLLAFIGTNIDNFIFISVMLAAANNRQERIRVVLAQYIGLAALVCISMAGTGLLSLLPMQYVRFLGFLPMIIGIKGLLKAKDGEKDNGGSGDIPSLPNLIMINLSGGMDNISVYVPLFEGFAGVQTFLMLAVIFAGMMLIWCFAAARVALLPFLRERIQRHSGMIVPAVYIMLGVYILLR